MRAVIVSLLLLSFLGFSGVAEAQTVGQTEQILRLEYDNERLRYEGSNARRKFNPVAGIYSGAACLDLKDADLVAACLRRNTPVVHQGPSWTSAACLDLKDADLVAACLRRNTPVVHQGPSWTSAACLDLEDADLVAACLRRNTPVVTW